MTAAIYLFVIFLVSSLSLFCAAMYLLHGLAHALAAGSLSMLLLAILTAAAIKRLAATGNPR